jgi:DNA polymerase bacteriophage-type
MIWLDFETRSRCDLKSRGVYNYAQDLSTDVLCMSYAFDDEDVATWLPGMPFPNIAGHQVMAHNAAFERLVFWYVLCPTLGIPEPPLERFTCTAAQARANCLPGSLGGRRPRCQQQDEERPPWLGIDSVAVCPAQGRHLQR